jgi:hypothetical protein
MSRRAYWSLLFLCAIACEKQEPSASTPQAPAPTGVAAAKGVSGKPEEPGLNAAAGDPGAGDVASDSTAAPPVEEDFEAQAEQELTLENLSAKLDAIEKQIGDDSL